MGSFTIELILPSSDASLLHLIRKSTSDEVKIEEFRSITVATIFLTAAAAVKLFAALVELRNKLRERPDQPAIKVKDASGKIVDLLNATDEALKKIAELAS